MLHKSHVHGDVA